jgi:phosphoribosylformylglycinamidine cyclo-ligase
VAAPGASRSGPGPATYKGAGVDIGAGEEAVARIASLVAGTNRPEVMGGIGGFGGLFSFDPTRYRQPVLVSSTDTVGTKAAVAVAAGRFDTLGLDLVAMCVDDVVCTGAEPLFLLDCISAALVDPGHIEELVAGVAHGCQLAHCALLGGEMAELGNTVPSGYLDLAGFAVGVVDRQEMLGAERVEVGDVLVGLPSPGLRCNGYSLARHVLFERAGLTLDVPAWPGADHLLADELLRPSVIYAPAVLDCARALGPALHAAAHVTGGGIPGNLARVLPDRLDAVVERAAWSEPRIFDEVRRAGVVAEDEMEKVFNLGVGMILVVAPDAAAEARRVLGGAGIDALEIGRVVEGAGEVRLVR